MSRRPTSIEHANKTSPRPNIYSHRHHLVLPLTRRAVDGKRHLAADDGRVGRQRHVRSGERRRGISVARLPSERGACGARRGDREKQHQQPQRCWRLLAVDARPHFAPDMMLLRADDKMDGWRGELLIDVDDLRSQRLKSWTREEPSKKTHVKLQRKTSMMSSQEGDAKDGRPRAANAPIPRRPPRRQRRSFYASQPRPPPGRTKEAVTLKPRPHFRGAQPACSRRSRRRRRSTRAPRGC